MTDLDLLSNQALECPPWKPFPCPEGECIPLNYVCDKNDDCPSSGYDEDERMCTASKIPFEFLVKYKLTGTIVY